MKNYDIVIIGGSYAGLSAALPLVRARKRVLVIDAGLRRNRFAVHSHGFLTQDGRAPDLIIQDAKHQLEQYASFDWQLGTVQRIETANDNFYVCIDKEVAVCTKRIILAMGVKDQIPEINGLQERWGKTIFHCPYCHGYELNQGNIGMLLSSSQSLHVALMLPDWGNTTLLVNGHQHLIDQLDEKTKNLLVERKVKIDGRIVERITDSCCVQFKNGDSLNLNGLFVSTQPKIEAEWISNIGVEIETTDFGQFIKTSQLKETSVEGIFACGDVARLGGSVPLAVADGNIAGIAAHKSLIY